MGVPPPKTDLEPEEAVLPPSKTDVEFCGGTEASGAVGCEELPSLASLHAAASQLPAHCELLVATAVFEATRALPTGAGFCGAKGERQERRKAQMRAARRAPLCHVAFVDWVSERALKQHQEDELTREQGSVAFVGCWQLLSVGAAMPLWQPQANALLPKLLLPLLFPNATVSLWLDPAAPPPHEHDLPTLARAALAPPAAMLAHPAPPGAAAAEAAEADASLVARRHAPHAEAARLACAWWRAWRALPRAAARGGGSGDAERQAAREAAAALRALGPSVTSFELPPPPKGKDLRASKPSAPLPPRAAAASWPSVPLSQPRRCAAPPPDAAALARLPKLRFRAAARTAAKGGEASEGAGASSEEREGWFGLEAATLAALPCGVETAVKRRSCGTEGEEADGGGGACRATASSPFEEAARKGARGGRGCDVIVLTAIFEGYDRLIQPSEQCALSAAERDCFFAFVDKQSHDLLLYENAGRVAKDEAPLVRRAKDGAPPRVGVWQLLLVSGVLPFRSSRRNSRIPKLLPHRLFPEARRALWLDSKLQLHVPPSQLAARFLSGGVVFAALRNFRRDHIEEERDWIWRHKCGQKVEECADLIRQWAAYNEEQTEPGWEARTSAIEGCLLLQDLQVCAATPPLRTVLCAHLGTLRRGRRRCTTCSSAAGGTSTCATASVTSSRSRTC